MVGDVTQYLGKEYKNTPPFDSRKVSRQERINSYREMTPDIEMALRKSMGDEAVDVYKEKMEGLLQKRRTV